MAFEVYLSLMPFYYRQLGFSNAQFGLLIGIQSVPVFFADIPSSVIADRFSNRFWLVAGIAIAALGALQLALYCPNFSYAILGNLLIGLGRACRSSADLSLPKEAITFYQVDHPDDRTIRSFIAWSASMNYYFGLSEALAALTAMSLIWKWPHQGPHIAFYIHAAMYVALIPLALMITEPTRQPRARFRDVLRGRLWGYICFSAVIGNAASTTFVFMTPHLNSLGLKEIYIPLVVAACYLTMAILSRFTEFYQRLIGRHMAASLLGWVCTAYLLLWLAPGWWSMAGFIAMYVVMILYTTILADNLMTGAPGWKATALSICSGLNQLMIISINPIIGWGGGHKGRMSEAWGISLAIHASLGAALLLIIRGFTPSNERTPTNEMA